MVRIMRGPSPGDCADDGSMAALHVGDVALGMIGPEEEGKEFDRLVAAVWEDLLVSARYGAEPGYLLHVLVCSKFQRATPNIERSKTLQKLTQRERAAMVGGLRALRRLESEGFKEIFGPPSEEWAQKVYSGIEFLYQQLMGGTVETLAFLIGSGARLTRRQAERCLTACIVCLLEELKGRHPKPVVATTVLLEKFGFLDGSRGVTAAIEFVKKRAQRAAAAVSDSLGPIGNRVWHLRLTYSNLKEFLMPPPIVPEEGSMKLRTIGIFLTVAFGLFVAPSVADAQALAPGVRIEVGSSAAEPPTDVQLTLVAEAPAQPGRFVVLNFDTADIEVVIRAASEIVGFNYVLAPDVRGKVTVQTSTRIPQEEVFNVLLAVLEVYGFTAVKADTLYKIIKLEGARERPVPTVVGTAPDPAHIGDEIITQIVPIRFAPIPDLTALLRPLISTRGSLTAHPETNLLVITDAAANIRRLLEIIKLVDVEVALGELQVIPLTFADAQELANILNQLFAPGRLRPPGPPGVSIPPPPRVPGAPPGVPRSPAEAPGPERPPFIAAYRGINVLVVHARKAETELIRRLVTQLDVDLYAGRRVFIYFPEHVKAKDLAATLNAIYGRAEVAPGAPPPAPPPGPAPPGPAAPRGRGAPRRLLKGELRFIPDEAANAVIVTMSPREGPGREEIRKEPPPEATEAPGRRAGTPPTRSARTLPGFVIIDATPADAQVFLDGQLLGFARQLVARAFPVQPGKHAMEVVAPGFKPYGVVFPVSPTFPRRLHVSLQPE